MAMVGRDSLSEGQSENLRVCLFRLLSNTHRAIWGKCFGMPFHHPKKIGEMQAKFLVARGRISGLGEEPFELPSEGPKPSMLLWAWTVHYTTGLHGLQACANYLTFCSRKT